MALLRLLLAALGCWSVSSLDSDDFESIYSSISGEFVPYTIPFRSFPPRFEKTGGLWPSKIRFEGVPDVMKIFGMDDANAFTSFFIVDSLLEAAQTGHITLSDSMMIKVFKEIHAFQDLNQKPNAPIYCFWPQVDSHANNPYPYYASATNVIKMGGNLQGALAHLEKLIPDAVWPSVRAYLVKPPLQQVFQMRIPADADDSGNAMAVQYNLWKLSKTKYATSTIKKLYATYRAQNSDMSVFTEQFLKYAWYPWGRSYDQRVEDTRSFYVLREFLWYQEEKYSKSQLENFAIVNTWTLMYSENLKYHKTITMPDNVNTFDAAVTANWIYGVLARLVEDHTEGHSTAWYTQNSAFRKLVENQGYILAWVLTSDIARKRPDLALPYYPSYYIYPWFLSRVATLCDEHQDILSSHASSNIVCERIQDALKTTATPHLLNDYGADNEGYWNGWLGSDSTWLGLGSSHKQSKDSVFITSMNVIALLNTWTVKSGSSREWASDVSTHTKHVVTQAVGWLKENWEDDDYTHTAFFTADIKGHHIHPALYPGDLFKTLDGKTVNPRTAPYSAITENLVSAVTKVPDKAAYQYDLTRKQFGEYVDQTNYQYPLQERFADQFFVYWDSPALTMANVLQAFTRFKALQGAPVNCSVLSETSCNNHPNCHWVEGSWWSSDTCQPL